MASIIIYTDNVEYLSKTIYGIIDTSPPELLDEILVCGNNPICPLDCVVISDDLPKNKLLNIAARQAKSEILVFVPQEAKVVPGWLEKLVDVGQKGITIPKVYELDTNLWCCGHKCVERVGWRWDLMTYNRVDTHDYSPSVLPCFAINKQWFLDVGGFDEDMEDGDEESLEFGIRNCLFGGMIRTTGACVAFNYEYKSTANLSRIIEFWFPAYASRFYELRGLDVTPTRSNYSYLTALLSKQVISVDDYLRNYLPELVNIYALQGTASNKSIAILGSGPSLDVIVPAIIQRHDLIVGIDRAAYHYDCDYIITSDSDVVRELRSRYEASKFVVPVVMHDRLGRSLNAEDLLPGCRQYEVCDDVNMFLSPPFMNFGNELHAAIHFALFLRPELVTVFGSDNKIVDGKRYSRLLFPDEAQWAESSAMKYQFDRCEYGLRILAQLAEKNGINLLRTNYV